MSSPSLSASLAPGSKTYGLYRSVGLLAPALLASALLVAGALPAPVLAGDLPETVPLPGTQFEIGKYEVTVEQWRAFLKSSDYQWDEWARVGKVSPDAVYPIVYVSWNDAQAYCHWLTNKLRRRCRLPTEAEWLAAAYGDSKAKYPWGDDPIDATRANVAGDADGFKEAAPATRFLPGASPAGCHNMLGNVWEWTADYYDKDKVGHALLGGSYVDLPQRVGRKSREWGGDNDRRGNIGFRILITDEALAPPKPVETPAPTPAPAAIETPPPAAPAAPPAPTDDFAIKKTAPAKGAKGKGKAPAAGTDEFALKKAGGAKARSKAAEPPAATPAPATGAVAPAQRLDEIKALVNAKKYDDARQAYTQFLAEHPDNVEALNNLGVVHMLAGEKAQAVACWKRALELDPANQKAADNLKKAGE